MSIIYVLIPIAVLLTAIGIYLFFWAVKTEQFDDLEKQGMSILFDDDNDKISQQKVNHAELTDSPVKVSQLNKNNEQTRPTDKPVEK